MATAMAVSHFFNTDIFRLFPEIATEFPASLCKYLSSHKHSTQLFFYGSPIHEHTPARRLFVLHATFSNRARKKCLCWIKIRPKMRLSDVGVSINRFSVTVFRFRPVNGGWSHGGIEVCWKSSFCRGFVMVFWWLYYFFFKFNCK